MVEDDAVVPDHRPCLCWNPVFVSELDAAVDRAAANGKLSKLLFSLLNVLDGQ